MVEEGVNLPYKRCINKDKEKSSAALKYFEGVYSGKQIEEKIADEADKFRGCSDHLHTRNCLETAVEGVYQVEYNKFDNRFVQDRHTEIPSTDENLTRTPGRKCVPKSSGGDDRKNTTRKQDHQAQFTERRCFLPSQCFENTNTENTDFHSAYDTRSCFALCGRSEVSNEDEY